MNSNTYYVQKINLNGELIWNYPASIGTIVLDYRGNIYSSSSKLSSNGSIRYGNIPDATGVGIPIAVDDEGYIFIYGKYADKLGILKYKDNYTLEKIAVLKEREVTE